MYGSHSCTYLPPSLHRCPALFGILAEWLHSHHLGQLTERVSASDLTCSWFSASAVFWCPSGDDSMALAELSTHKAVIIGACMHAHIHTCTHSHLTVTAEHWRNHTSLSLFTESAGASFSIPSHLSSLLPLAPPISSCCQPFSSPPRLALDTATGELFTRHWSCYLPK